MTHQQLPDLCRAGKAELAHERIGRHLPSDQGRVLGIARDDRQHARRDAGLLGERGDRSAESGVCSAGFSTIVQPTASAGADFLVTIAEGKFQGVMPAVTPTGSRVTTIRRSGAGDGMTDPSRRFASSANHS